MKECKKCSATKPLTDFHKNGAYVSGYINTCRSCIYERVKQWRKNNPEARKKEHTRAYAKVLKRAGRSLRVLQTPAERKEKVRLAGKKYYENNKEALNAQQQQHYRNNTEMYRAKDSKYRATKLNATVEWCDYQYVQDLFKNAKEASLMFQAIGLDWRFEVDHIVPLNNDLVCGLHCEDNLQVLERAVNRAKSNKFEVV